MITVQRSHYLSTLAPNSNILLLSNNTFPAFDFVKEDFNFAIQHNMHQAEFYNIHAVIFKNNINVILLDAVETVENAKKFYDVIKKYNPRVLIISIFSEKSAPHAVYMTKNSDMAIFVPFTYEEFKGKLFDALSVFYTIESIGTKLIEAENIDDFDVFLNLHAANVLYIVDELIEINIFLRNGVLSHEILKDISERLAKIAAIFNLNSKFSKLAPVYIKLANFIGDIALSKIKPSKLKVFDYIADIIDDINTSLMFFFDKKMISETSMYQYSFEKNIDLLFSLLYDEEENSSDLEFFDD